jgi:hypothetical protein
VSFPTKVAKSGYCCGVETSLTFATKMSILTCGHIHNHGTQKDGLMKKRLQRTILDFYHIYYFMIIVDWYMITTKMMSC